MKKLSILLLSLAVAFLAGCSKSPTSVVKDFANSVKKLDINSAKKCLPKETEKAIDEGIKLFNEKFKTIKYVEEKIDGDKATVVAEIDGKKVNVSLKKEDGKWKIYDAKYDLDEFQDMLKPIMK